MRIQDWQHRVAVLRAWQAWSDGNNLPNFLGRDETYRAVLDGCAITVRALCREVEVCANFGDFKDKLEARAGNRSAAIGDCCHSPKVTLLGPEERRCLLEVLYLANRAVAHPQDGDLDHGVRQHEMTSAINTLFRWIAEDHPAGLPNDCSDLLRPIAEPQVSST